MSEQSRVMAGALVGAMAGAVAAYLFFTEGGRGIRDRIEPTVDDLRREFDRFQGTIAKLGDMANEGMRVVNEFQSARAQGSFGQARTSH